MLLDDQPATSRLARAQSARGEIVLSSRRTPRTPRGTVLELRVNGVYVMDDHETSSEEILARAALAACPSPRRVLVGGLGLGFTVAQVLRDPRVREVVVVEIEGMLVEWMRAGTIPCGPALLADPRLRVVVADLREVLDQYAGFDVVLVDVDNGPANLVFDTNAAIYAADGLAALAGVLDDDGVLAVWSADRCAGLAEAMAQTFGEVIELPCSVHRDTRPTDYHCYLGHGISPDVSRDTPPDVSLGSRRP